MIATVGAFMHLAAGGLLTVAFAALVVVLEPGVARLRAAHLSVIAEV